MAEEEEITEILQPEFPLGRVKKIMKLDKEIKKVNSEALFLVSLSTDLFLRFLAERSGEIAVEKKRKTVKLEHLRIATKKHQPTSDFLIDSLPMPPTTTIRPATAQNESASAFEKTAGTRTINDFFRSASNGTKDQAE